MSTVSDSPSRLRSMADLSPEVQTVTKIVPQGAAFLREVARYIEDLEWQLAEQRNDRVLHSTQFPRIRTS